MNLIIDTSSEELRVILQNNKDYIINKETGTKHLEHLLPEIDRLLSENKASLKDINTYSVVVGPGSFTGVRIGVATIKAFCSVYSNAKIVGINMLDLLSHVIISSNTNINNDFAIIIKSTSTKYYLGIYNCSGKCLSQKLSNREEIGELFENIKNVFSYNFEENFGKQKTKKIILMPGNYVNYLEMKTNKKDFTKLKELKPVYLALSQAEIELLKKENKNANNWN